MRTKIQNDIKVCEIKEKAFKTDIEKRWGCQLKKLAIVYGFDYAVVKGSEIRGFLELKNRNFQTTDFNDSIINLNKWMKAKELRDATGLPTILACRYNNKDIFCNLTMETDYKLKWGARTKNTRDWQDIQPAVHINIKEFKELK